MNRLAGAVLGLLMALVLSSCSSPDRGGEPRTDPDSLRLRLEAALSGNVYLTVSESDVRISIRNLDLKTLPVESHIRLGDTVLLHSSVLEIVPDVHQARVQVVDIGESEAELDKSGTISSQEEMVSVVDMPDLFQLTLEDGSLIWVEGSGASGISHWFSTRWIDSLSRMGYLWSRLQGGTRRVVHLRMDSDSARQFYWALKPGTWILY